MHTSAGDDDAYVCKLDATGAFQWVTLYGGEFEERGNTTEKGLFPDEGWNGLLYSLDATGALRWNIELEPDGNREGEVHAVAVALVGRHNLVLPACLDDSRRARPVVEADVLLPPPTTSRRRTTSSPKKVCLTNSTISRCNGVRVPGGLWQALTSPRL